MPIYRFIEGEIPSAYYKGKLILIGPYAVVMNDYYHTPMSTKVQMNGVEIHANITQSLVENNIYMEIKKNEILAVIGPNGTGKTTTLEIISGLRMADGGEVKYWTKEYKRSMGIQLQAVPFFPGLTAFENLRLFAAFYKLNISDLKTREVLHVCGLGESGNTEASKPSGGQQKRLAIAVAIIHNPNLIFLDEPTAALDPRSKQEIHHLIIKTLNQEGKTIVFTSHDMDEVYKLADRVIMINHGEIIA